MLVIDEHTMRVLRDLHKKGMTRAEVCDYLGVTRNTLDRASKRDGYYNELLKLWPHSKGHGAPIADTFLCGIKHVPVEEAHIPLKEMSPQVRALTQRWA